MKSYLSEENDISDRIDRIFAYLSSQTRYRPQIGIICGSGLSGLSDILQNTETIAYDSIPSFPKPTVQGHTGELVFGQLNSMNIVCMRGRFHTYEGYHVRETVLPIRVLYLLGVRYLIVTNAAGGLNPEYKIGDYMILSDHLNIPGLAGNHPLRGPNDTRFGPRFLALNNCYDKKLQEIAKNTAINMNLLSKVRMNGVYCYVSGPTYETCTESKFLRLVGGDAVGMSTVPEVIAAIHCGMHVLGISIITNKLINLDETNTQTSHTEVLEAADTYKHEFKSFIHNILQSMEKNTITVRDNCNSHI